MEEIVSSCSYLYYCVLTYCYNVLTYENLKVIYYVTKRISRNRTHHCHVEIPLRHDRNFIAMVFCSIIISQITKIRRKKNLNFRPNKYESSKFILFLQLVFTVIGEEWKIFLYDQTNLESSSSQWNVRAYASMRIICLSVKR